MGDKERPRSTQTFTRRQALKALIAASAAAAGAATPLPPSWSTPRVAIGALPAHAQISPVDQGLHATATTVTQIEGQYGDFDFGMCTPNSILIWGGVGGDGGTSSLDTYAYFPRAADEWVHIEPGAAVPGVYSLYLENWTAAWHQQRIPLAMEVEITTAAGVFSTQVTLTDDRAVADILFPGGAVTWRSDAGGAPCAIEPARAAGKSR